LTGGHVQTSDTKRILILAGPNGAGKTTFAREFLIREAECPTFVNADLIAAGLSPFDPALAAISAARLMLQVIAGHVRRGESFAYETTLSDRARARAIPAWRSAGYHVSLWFLSLPTADMAVARVAHRVQQGGHAVSDAVVRRRFQSGRANFDTVYKPAVDDWALYDNSGAVPVLLDWGEN
jgi:predicted ABC-type ATPase